MLFRSSEESGVGGEQAGVTMRSKIREGLRWGGMEEGKMPQTNRTCRLWVHLKEGKGELEKMRW